jgi:hypothetical protein
MMALGLGSVRKLRHEEEFLCCFVSRRGNFSIQQFSGFNEEFPRLVTSTQVNRDATHKPSPLPSRRRLALGLIKISPRDLLFIFISASDEKAKLLAHERALDLCPS